MPERNDLVTTVQLPAAGLLRRADLHHLATRLETFDAAGAKAMGLASKVVPQSEGDRSAAKAASRPVERPTDLLRSATGLLKRPRADVDDRIRDEIALRVNGLRRPAVRKRLSRIAALRRRATGGRTLEAA